MNKLDIFTGLVSMCVQFGVSTLLIFVYCALISGWLLLIIDAERIRLFQNSYKVLYKLKWKRRRQTPKTVDNCANFKILFFLLLDQ